MVQYYHSFLPGLATTLAPSHWLLQKNVQWEWIKDFRRLLKPAQRALLVIHCWKIDEEINREINEFAELMKKKWD